MKLSNGMRLILLHNDNDGRQFCWTKPHGFLTMTKHSSGPRKHGSGLCSPHILPWRYCWLLVSTRWGPSPLCVGGGVERPAHQLPWDYRPQSTVSWRMINDSLSWWDDGIYSNHLGHGWHRALPGVRIAWVCGGYCGLADSVTTGTNTG